MESLMNKEKRNLMGQNGIRRVFQMFSLQNMGEELEAHIAY